MSVFKGDFILLWSELSIDTQVRFYEHYQVHIVPQKIQKVGPFLAPLQSPFTLKAPKEGCVKKWASKQSHSVLCLSIGMFFAMHLYEGHL